MSKAGNAGFAILKLGDIRGDDQFHHQGYLHNNSWGVSEAPECQFCGRDAYELLKAGMQLYHAGAGGVNTYYCLDDEQEAAYTVLEAVSETVDLEEGGQ